MDPKDFKGISNEATRAILIQRIREARAEQESPSETTDRGGVVDRSRLARVYTGFR